MFVSWSCKKQNSMPPSTTKTKYLTAGSYYAEILWIKQQLSILVCP